MNKLEQIKKEVKEKKLSMYKGEMGMVSHARHDATEWLKFLYKMDELIEIVEGAIEIAEMFRYKSDNAGKFLALADKKLKKL